MSVWLVWKTKIKLKELWRAEVGHLTWFSITSKLYMWISMYNIFYIYTYVSQCECVSWQQCTIVKQGCKDLQFFDVKLFFIFSCSFCFFFWILCFSDVWILAVSCVPVLSEVLADEVLYCPLYFKFKQSLSYATFALRSHLAAIQARIYYMCFSLEDVGTYVLHFGSYTWLCINFL